MNKKGIIPLTIPVALFFLILFLGLIFGIGFLFSGTLRWVIIGIAVLIGFVYLVGQAMTSEFTRPKIIVLLVFLGVGVFFILGAGVLQTTFIGDVFVKPLWGNLACKTDGVYENDVLITTNKDGSWIDCGKTELVNSCKILIESSAPSYWNDKINVKYSICQQGGSCGIEQSIQVVRGEIDKELAEIKSGQTIFIRFESIALLINQPGQIIKRFDSFKLINDYGGVQTINSKNCDVPSSKLSNILQSDLSGENKNSNCAVRVLPGDYCNYVVDWFYGPGTNIVNHPTYGQAYCSGNKLYDIVEVKVATGQVQLLEPTYQGIKADGSPLRGLGDYLGTVDCCPTAGNPYCGDDFKYIQNVGQSECNSDVECSNDFVYFESNKVRQQKCISNKCIWQTAISVSCADDRDCGSGQACQRLGDISQWKCVSVSGDGGIIKPSGKVVCEQKSKESPFMGWTWTETSTEVGKGPFGIGSIIGLTKTITSGECKPQFLIYWVLGGIVVILGSITLFLIFTKKPKRGKK